MGNTLREKLIHITLGLTVALFAVSLCFPLTAYAAPKQPDDEVKSYIWYKALEKCFADAVVTNGNSVDDITTHKWFTNTSVAVGYLNTGEGAGTASCSDTNMVSNAMTYWQLGDAVPAWCTVMQYDGPWRDGNNRDCVTGDGLFKTGAPGATLSRSDSFKRTVEQKFYNSDKGEPSLSDPAKYYLYYNSLTSLCGAKPVVKVSEANATQKAIVNSDKGYQIRFVNSSNVVEDWIYQGQISKTSNVPIFEGKDKGGYPPCSQLAEWIGQNADQFAAYAKVSGFGAPDPGSVTGGGDGTDTGTTTCGIKTAIGWILCPVTSFLADMLDNMYNFISDQFLSTPATLFATDSGTYTAWTKFRDYANIAFIIAFLIIVYSQVTSVGISNYGIKKMLPKLIIAAVLVNISFFICQAMVDLSNVFGYGIKQLFDGIVQEVNKSDSIIIGGGGADGSGGVGQTIGLILGGAAVVAIALALGLLIPALLAVAIVFLILLLRRTLIIILIVLSPIAFVAYLLPNTEKLFKQWWNMFVQVLLVFPIIALVVGGSKLASAIVQVSADDSNVSKMIAVGILTVPFFTILPLLNKSLKALPVFGAKLQNMGNKATGKFGKQASAKAKEKWNRTSIAQGKKLRDAGKEQYRRKRFAERVSGGGLSARLAKGVPITRGQRAGAEHLTRSALSAVSKEESDDVNSAIIEMSKNWSEQEKISKAGEAFQKAMEEGNAINARAAQQILLSSGNKGIQELHSSFDALGQKSNYAAIMQSEAGQKVSSDLNKAGVKGKDAALAKVAFESPDKTISDFKNDKSTFGALTDSELATQSKGNIQSAISSGAIDATRAKRMLDNQGVRAALSGDNYDLISNVASGSTGGTGPTPPSGTPPAGSGGAPGPSGSGGAGAGGAGSGGGTP